MVYDIFGNFLFYNVLPFILTELAYSLIQANLLAIIFLSRKQGK